MRASCFKISYAESVLGAGMCGLRLKTILFSIIVSGSFATLLNAAPASFVKAFQEICLSTAPRFENAVEIAADYGIPNEKSVFDSHERYTAPGGDWSLQFRHLKAGTNQCEVVSHNGGLSKELPEFEKAILEMAKSHDAEVFSRGGFHQMLIENVNYLINYDTLRHAFSVVTIDKQGQ